MDKNSDNFNYKYYLDEGIYDIQAGNFESAIEKITKSIELKNDFEISYFYRAVAHQALKNSNEAILDYTKAIKLNDKMTDAYYNRAYILLASDNASDSKIENIISDLTKALELDENFVDALYAMAAAKKKQQKYHEALEYLERLLNIQPDAINAKALKKLILMKYIV